MKANWTNRRKILTKSELRHLTKDAGCHTKAQFQNVINKHTEWRKENEHLAFSEPCWDCRFIAEKLDMKAKEK